MTTAVRDLMKKSSVLAQVLDRLHLTRNPQRLTSSATPPMSDRELALAIREVKRTSAAEQATQMPATPEPQHSPNEEDARIAERARELTYRAFKLLRDPVPDTFLGRKTQSFPDEDEE